MYVLPVQAGRRLPLQDGAGHVRSHPEGCELRWVCGVPTTFPPWLSPLLANAIRQTQQACTPRCTCLFHSCRACMQVCCVTCHKCWPISRSIWVGRGNRGRQVLGRSWHLYYVVVTCACAQANACWSGTAARASARPRPCSRTCSAASAARPRCLPRYVPTALPILTALGCGHEGYEALLRLEGLLEWQGCHIPCASVQSMSAADMSIWFC